MFKIINSLLNSWSGLIWAFKNDKSVRMELILLGLVLAALYFIKLAILKKVLMLLSLLFVIVVELINTALEKLADRITTNYDENIKYSKDSASAAVLLAIVITSFVWLYCIFY
jgi:diacylglycerol kinase (ATP)